MYSADSGLEEFPIQGLYLCEIWVYLIVNNENLGQES